MGSAIPVAAQAWNDARTMALVTRATERRSRQLADTGLTSYTATALGSLTFLAQVGEGFPDPPKVVKADQIALEVYWRAPNSSKQLILGRRDTLLLPTDIQYHRDHLGIVQNNFPEIIRLGEGDEVRDVPHPLSAAGLATYEYALGDSLRIGIPGQVIEVQEVLMRPRDDRRAAAVGAMYLSLADAQVVRMAFSFTRAALIDAQLEDVAIVLDNALIEERFWLPRRQEIEIRRRGTWLDFPARGIIRGGWEICCYQVNQLPPDASFTGPEIELAPSTRRAVFEFQGDMASVIPTEVATVTGEDVRRVQAQARELVRARALSAPSRGGASTRSVSDLLRINRTEGVSLGAGAGIRMGESLTLGLTARYGLSDEQFKGTVRLTRELGPTLGVMAGAFDHLTDASTFAERSGAANSIAAQEFATDATEWYRVRGAELGVSWRPRAGQVQFRVARERADSAPVSADPARGSFRGALPVETTTSWLASLRVDASRRPMLAGAAQAVLAYSLRVTDEQDAPIVGRLVASLQYDRVLPAGRLVFETRGGLTSSSLAQDQMFAGGPVTGPGYAPHSFASAAMVSTRAEWQFPVPFPSVPLGRWGRTPGAARLAPYVAVVVQREGAADDRVFNGYPSVGVAVLTFFDLVRVDVMRGLRGGRWRLGFDLSRDLWPVL